VREEDETIGEEKEIVEERGGRCMEKKGGMIWRNSSSNTRKESIWW
jgi:hypothetical protein